jgi:hypothetical protein
MKTGVELIAEERDRQIKKEGWDEGHDDMHKRKELARAARAYALPGLKASTEAGIDWPWHDDWWKPSNDPVRNLVKAGALIAAEIDRLQRLQNGAADSRRGETHDR